MNDLGKGSQTVSGARCVGDDVEAGFVFIVINSADEEGSIIFGRG